MKPTKKQKALGKEWGWGEFEVEHGYGIFESDNGYTYVCRIDDMEVFESDEEAVEQAKKDGFKFIKFNIIDNDKNRKLLAKNEPIPEDCKWYYEDNED